MVTGVEEMEIPVAAYLIDTHLHYSWQRHFVGLFDQVFVAQKDAAVSLHRRYHACRWMPLFSRYGDLKQEVAKTHNVVFVGTVDQKRNSERVAFLADFARSMPIQISSGDYRETYNSARIILNQSVGNDINFRVFEALASGSFLLTDDVDNGLEQLFEDGRHLVVYRKGDVSDAVSKACYYLDHPLERERIAAAGHQLVIARHTLETRSQELLQELAAVRLPANPAMTDERHYAKKHAAVRTYLAIALLMSDLESHKGDGYYGQRISWYLRQAVDSLQKVLPLAVGSEEVMPDLALLAFMQGEAGKAAAYTRIALLEAPDDCELLLLAARIADSRGEHGVARKFYDKAAQVIEQLRQRPEERLLAEVLADRLEFQKNK